MHSLPYLSNIITVKQTQVCWWQLNNVGCRTFTVHVCLKVLQVYWLRLDSNSYDPIWCIYYHGPRSFIIWIQPRTVTFRKKGPQRRKSGWLFGPPSWSFVSWNWKKKVENTDCNKLRDLEKVAGEWHGIRSKVTGLGMARALHWKSIHGTERLECLVVSFPQRLYSMRLINRSVM